MTALVTPAPVTYWPGATVPEPTLVMSSTLLEAVQDALGKEHAAKVAKMKAGDAKAYAIKHVPKTGWVPEALRI